MTDGRYDEKNVEVIAEKSRTAAYVFLALAAVGVIVAAAGVFLFITIKFENADVVIKTVEISLTAVGAALLIVFGGLFIKQLFRPYTLISLEGGALTFPDGTKCKTNEIIEITVSKDGGKCGKLIVALADRKMEVNGVANCDKAHAKLCMLAGKLISDGQIQKV